MGYFSAIPRHAHRFASENAFQDGARVACQIGGAYELHFYTSHQKMRNDAYRYMLLEFSTNKKWQVTPVPVIFSKQDKGATGRSSAAAEGAVMTLRRLAPHPNSDLLVIHYGGSMKIRARVGIRL
jgi:hypothetical protein